jgi:hypothetical protein
MKIKKAHIDYMKAEIEKTLAIHNKRGELVEFYESGQVKAKDLQMRFCFDLAYGAGLSAFISSEIYPYANDQHLFTALKAICPRLEIKK